MYWKNSEHTARDFCKLQGKCFLLFYPVQQYVCSLSAQTQNHIDNCLCAFAEGTSWSSSVSKAGLIWNFSYVVGDLSYLMQVLKILQFYLHYVEITLFISDQLSKFRYNFEMILEGEVNVDKLQEHLTACEGRETKLKKDLLKATKKNNDAEARQIENKIMDNRSSIKSTQTESKCSKYLW